MMRFGMTHSQRCLGVILLHPTAMSATLFDNIQVGKFNSGDSWLKGPSLHIPMSTKLGGMQAVQYLLLHSSLKLDFPFQTFQSTTSAHETKTFFCPPISGNS